MNSKILKGPKLKQAAPKKSLGQLFFDCATLHGDKLCQVDGTADATESYSSVKQRSTRVAIALQERGITSKDVIAFCTGNTLDTVIPILATFYLGAKVANLDPSLSVRQTQHLIALVSPKIIFVEENAVELIENSLKQTSVKTEIIVYGRSGKYTSLGDLIQPRKNEATFRPPGVDLNEVALIFFSSGTTGLPKAICHSHKTCMLMGCTLQEYDWGQAVLHFTTFYWITAVFMLISSFMTGGYRLFLRSMDPEITLRTVEKYKVDNMFLAPILVNNFMSLGGDVKYDTSSLRIILCGGGPMSSVQQKLMSRLFQRSTILCVYGMTEVGCISLFHDERDKEFAKTKPLSCGKPFYELDLKIVDVESGQTVGTNQKGEIRVDTPCTFIKYYNADCSDVFDEEGFLKTGDIGYYDEDGCLYVIDRIKEMFKYKSWHIVPSLIEKTLTEHPAVKEAAVFGVPSGDDGEIPAACIVLKDGAKATKEEIKKFMDENVSDRERLRGGIKFVTSLPKTPTGKFIRKEIKNSYIEAL
ncbi:uncharacterized protein LOC658566 [Tribolium castaneum]|uniref:Luciferin 4-monooxygenase-like Protein n=1 Tax=Tribolium castaneum TaxID=7070 RepID=D6WF95_TRICA|nr:PREDICTED: 4-coumarate--CoA ligase 1 [Tribolium castaneum]EFA00290.1 Luciferin 4-monooxygenase-like Protein [Tribolium castaneum]|eukprot:XP_008190667.1 PREDICTED: 4-coumarate--CoA ligase 1 [Tribolium castaneum]